MPQPLSYSDGLALWIRLPETTCEKNGAQTVSVHLPALLFIQHRDMVEINGCRQEQDGPVESRVFVMTRRTESFTMEARQQWCAMRGYSPHFACTFLSSISIVILDCIEELRPYLTIITLTGQDPNKVIPRLNVNGISHALFKPIKLDYIKAVLACFTRAESTA
jgi:hypothetical protein